MLRENLENIERRIREACGRCGRAPETVSIVAVTKTRGPERVIEAADAGLRVFGESRVQEARQKIPQCPGTLEWHFIGHLQTNKVRDAVRLFRMIHSVDSERLLTAIDGACGAAGVTMRVALEVNVSGERSKFGMKPDEVPAALDAARRLMNVDVVGLMTIPPAAADPEEVRPFFRRLRELRDRWAEQTGFGLADLSMGMSGDFEVAVEEGATWIRIGTALFGERSAHESGG